MLPQFVLFLASPTVHSTILAYVDPGSGTLIWQLATAAVLGVMFYARTLLQKIRVRSRSREGTQETTKEQEL